MNGLSEEISTELPAYDEGLAFSIMNALSEGAGKEDKEEDGRSDCSSEYCDDEMHKVDVVCDDDDCIEPVCESEEQFQSFLENCCNDFDFHNNGHVSCSIPNSTSTIPPLIKCEWAGCNAHYDSMNDLIEHVHNSHLNFVNLDCKWGGTDCNVCPPSTSTNTQPDAHSILRHVLQDHLQVADDPLALSGAGQGAQGTQGTQQTQNNLHTLQNSDNLSIAIAHHDYPDLNPYAHHLHATAFPHLHPPSICPAATHASMNTNMNTNMKTETEKARPIHPPHPPKPHHHHHYHTPHYHHHPYPRPNTCTIAGPPYRCDWLNCKQHDVEFGSTEELMTHLSTEHVGSGKAEYSCMWRGCEKSGSGSGSSSSSTRGRVFSSRQKIMRHLQSHTGHRPFECPVCHRFFSEAATLQQHMRKHTREKPYVCDYQGCGKAFAIAGALTIHKRTHTNERPFKCTFCDKAFSESSNLKKHLRTHTGDRPFECPHPSCDKRFARPDQVTRHQNVHYKQYKHDNNNVNNINNSI
ncbi:hypothetical protein E3P98_00758 [Wallemia ichthyophaga]|nr:hypothetical protein E3P98_00758 [Wallemia ichthyophaga]